MSRLLQISLHGECLVSVALCSRETSSRRNYTCTVSTLLKISPCCCCCCCCCCCVSSRAPNMEEVTCDCLEWWIFRDMALTGAVTGGISVDVSVTFFLGRKCRVCGEKRSSSGRNGWKESFSQSATRLSVP
ncbi:hypothetical protein JOB18_046135 [Solea senegalensis]|uniref:Secreted protein n=1 Tax=Solea senegalensis TaxID=28829 RepID=A0AAV6R999_SOLSE|nr:hypothetical protein JOB18_046135 [Solea senegalensis]